MRKFQYYDYREKCQLASDIEDLLNDCGTPEEHLEKINLYFRRKGLTPKELDQFLMSCIGYWSEAECYDGRNDFAVFGCREIAKEFPLVKEMCDDDNLLLNAFGFTMSAHRYLQNELFKTILEYLKENESGVWTWWNEQELVYNSDATGLVPYKTTKI